MDSSSVVDIDGTVRVVASVKGTRTTAFEIASARCRNFVIIPAVVVLLAVGLYVHRFDSTKACF
jgi:hypothetical protein